VTNGSRVLLAGDAAARPAGLERALTRAGFLLAEALPAGEGLEPDVILVTLARASSDALRAALGDPASSPPVVVLVSEPDPDAPAVALAFGADDVVAHPVHLPELCARLQARIRDRQHPRGTSREATVRRSLESLLGEGRAGLRPDEVVLALVRRLARAFDLRSCAFIAVDPDGSTRSVAAAGQGHAHAEPDEAVNLADHPEVADALRLRRSAGRPDGPVIALPAIADGRVHGALELVRCDGRPALTAAQLQFADQLAEIAVRALKQVIAPAGNGAHGALRQVSPQATLDHRLQEELERARRYSLSFSLVLLEVCAAGADQGAETLERLQRGLRLPDFVARYTGGEYAIVLPETGAEGARRSVARVREHLQAGRNGGNAEPPLGAGIVTYPHPAVSQADDLFALVEAALARGKAQSGERLGTAD
jgi:GGDEF domain-containing protein/CheY-like chemotaxis protein